MMKNILIASDVDQNATKLVDHAAILAKAFGAKVWVVHTAAPDPDFVSMKVSSNYERDSRADQLRDEHKYIQELADGLKEQGIDADALLIQGPTVETLLEKAKDIKADLIISGMEEHGILYKAIIGSTTVKLLRKSKIPILSIPVDE
ncbi:MAG: universal stress protein [Bacteroidetes bacterium]|nr:universal stress protein [Bacteroidota bacterium]